ncbi:MAG: alkaline phosphatase [Planctomycetota bacterium]|nr:MAG: alkaline phosphatase [Planctomycetota bacterium]
MPTHLTDRRLPAPRLQPLQSAFFQPTRWILTAVITAIWAGGWTSPLRASDPWAELQSAAAQTGHAAWGHWGPDPAKYSSWTSHSNRLVPIYIFGADLKSVSGSNSPYRSADALQRLYGSVPDGTLNPTAEYFDQTDVFRLQQQAVAAGKRRVILFVFDGMDWQTTQAAAVARSGQVGYTTGRGTGLHFQDYRGTVTDFGFFVTSPHNDGTNVDVNEQRVTNPGGKTPGGYDAALGGEYPWSAPGDPMYPIAKSKQRLHAYTDSASSATSMTCGIKTYNNAINVDPFGREVIPIARTLQEQGFAVGAVSSVPISHATPACAYANNVHRNDYQDITRDQLGLPSIFHPGGLPGLDVLIGGGWGESRDKDGSQGMNYVPGNRYLSAADRAAIDVANGGKYIVAERTPGRDGDQVVREAVARARQSGSRLFGLFGTTGGHFPYQTADGSFDPVADGGGSSRGKAETYSPADIAENPSLATCALAAVEVLQSRSDRWWLMVEAGDVDWANHANNIDNSIGAVLSGDDALRALTAWIEQNGGWDDTLLIVTADHGHYLNITNPGALTGARQ